MNPLPVVLLALLQQAPAVSRAADAADKFSLDLPAPEPSGVRSTTEPAKPTAPVPTVSGDTFSLDTPIVKLIADYRARAVLDKDLPGLSTDEHLDKFESLSLRRFAPLTGGQLTEALLTKTAYDLAAIAAGGDVAPPTGRKSVRR